MRDMLYQHAHGGSPLHRLPAGPKLAAVLSVVVVTLAFPRTCIVCSLGLLAVWSGLAHLSRVPWRVLLRAILLLEPFVVGVSLLALVQPEGGLRFLSLLARSTLCVCMMVLYAATTPFSDLLNVLKRCRVPGLLLTTLALLYRYQFLLLEESGRMQRARRSRTFLKRRHLTWHGLSTVAAQLYLRSSERANRIYAAMCSRGWRP